MNNVYAVLTGDLVKSRALDDASLRQVQSALRQASEELAKAPWDHGGIVRGELDAFRGDSWQLLLGKPRWALRAAVYLRASLLVQGLCDTRISVGIGPVSQLSESRISLSTGEAFELSGHGLDQMGARFRMALHVAESCHPPGPWLGVVMYLCDSVIAQWQGRQIETARLRAYHKDASHEQIGTLLSPKVTQQAVSKSLFHAGWHGLGEAMEQFEAWKFDKQPG